MWRLSEKLPQPRPGPAAEPVQYQLHPPAGQVRHPLRRAGPWSADLDNAQRSGLHDLRLRRRLAISRTACVNKSPSGSVIHVWSADLGRGHWLLARRSLSDPTDIAYYAC